MNRWVRIGIIAGVAVGAIAALHFLVFAPLASEWQQANENYSENLQRYKNVTSLEKVNPEDKPKIIRNKRASNAINLSQLNRAYARYELVSAEPTIDSYDEFYKALLNVIHTYQNLESESLGKVSVLKSMGVGDALVQGKFGYGYLADDLHYKVFPARQYISQNAGTIELWVSPRWTQDGKDALASGGVYTLLCVTRAPTASPLGGGNEVEPPPAMLLEVNGDMNLSFQVNGTDGTSIVREKSVLNWQPDSWHYIAVTWDQSKRNPVSLWVDGSEARATASTSRTRTPMGYPSMGFPGMMPGMVPGSARAPAVRQPPSVRRSTSALLDQDLPQLGVLQSVVLGALESGLNPAFAVLDDFRISNRVRPNVAPPQRNMSIDGDTTFYYAMENEYIHPEYLPEILKDMEAQYKLKNSTVISQNSKKEQIQALARYRAIFGVDKKSLFSTGDSHTIFFRQFSAIDFILNNDPNARVDNILRLFGVDDKNSADYAKSWVETMKFKDLGLDLCELCLAKGVDRIDRLNFISSSQVLDEAGLSDYFDNEIKALETQYPTFASGGKATSSSSSYMQQMMMMMYMQQQQSAQNGAANQQGAGGPPMGFPGGGMGYPGMGMQTNAEDIAAARTKYNRWKKARDRGEIPSDVRDAFSKEQSKEGMDFYSKRVLSIGVTARMDAIAEILQALEFSASNDQPDEHWDHLTTVSSLSIEGVDDETVEADIEIAVHFMDRPTINPEEMERMKGEVERLEASINPDTLDDAAKPEDEAHSEI